MAAAAASYKTYTPQHSVRTDASVFPDVAYMLRALFSHLPLPQSLKIMMAFRRWASTRASSQSAESTPLFFITPLHVPPTSLFVSNSFESEVEIPSFPSYRLSVPAFLTSFFFLFFCHVTSSPYHLSAGLFRSTFSLAVVAPEEEHYSSSFLILESKVHILVPRNLKNEASEAHPSRFDFGVCLMQGTPANAPSYRVYER